MDIITKKGFKYDLQKLDSKLDEFLLVKKFFNITIKKSVHVYKDNIYSHQLKDFEIHKVMTDSKPARGVNEKSNNLMLFHGTDEKGANGILKEGFKNSSFGRFGQGVYMI